MSDKKRKPVISLIKYCWYVVAILIIIVAIFIQAARWATPSINQIKGTIENFASRQLNSQVAIGHISAKWQGLTPKISIQSLSVQYHSSFIRSQSSNRNRNFLNIGFASLELDILKSLFYWTPVWRDMEASEITAQLVQSKEGGWSLGEPIAKKNTQTRNWRYRSPSALFLTAQNVSLTDTDVTLIFNNNKKLVNRIPSMSIKNNGHLHRLEAKASVATNSSFNLIVEGVGDPSIPDQFFAKAYVKLENFTEKRLTEWFSQLTHFDIKQKLLQSSSANAELWFDIAATNRFLVTGHVNLNNVDSIIDNVENQNNTANTSEWHSDIVGGYTPTAGLTVGLRNIDIGTSFSIPSFVLGFKNEEVTVGVETLDLTRLNEWLISYLSRLPFFNVDEFSASITNELLASFNPQGTLNNLYMSVDINEPKKAILYANLDQVSTGVWKNIPAFSQITGYVESSLSNGFIAIDAKQFSLFPDTVYGEPIVADTAKGVVAWEIEANDKEVTIFGYDLSLSGVYGEAKGNFLLESSWGALYNKNQLVLQLGLKHSKARFHNRLIPRSLSKNLLSWMDVAIKEGELLNTGVFYKGGFAKNSPRSVQAFVDIDKGRLQFDPDWPEVNQINASLLIDNNRLFTQLNHASSYNDDAFSGEIKWNANLDNTLNIDISGDSSAASALRYIRNSRLKENTGDIVDQVSVKGDVSITIDLDLPIDDLATGSDSSSVGSTASRSLKHNVDVVLKGASLSFDEQDIQFNGINGALNVSSETGFSSKQLQLNFLDESFLLDMYEDPSAIDTLKISGKGRIDIQTMNKSLKQPLLSYLQGELSYAVDVRLPLGERSSVSPLLSISSDLTGVVSNLPKPFAKKVKDTLALDIKLPLTSDKRVYELVVGPYLYTKFSFGDQIAIDNDFSAFLSIGDVSVSKNIELPETGVRVLGQFVNFSVDEWFPVLQSLSVNNDTDGTSNTDSTKDEDNTPIDAGLFVSIENLKVSDQIFNQIIFSGEREVNGWRLIADNTDMLGSLTIFDDNQEPLLMEFDYINWPPQGSKAAVEINKVSDKVDLLAGVDPTLFPMMSVNVSRLNILEKPLGEWSFNVLPDEQGVDLRNINGIVSNFTLKGPEGSDGGFLRWETGSDKIVASTSIYAHIIGENPKVLFEQWNLPVALESKKATIDFNLSWPGSPLAIELETLTGTMRHHYEDGVFSQENIDDSSGLLRIFGLLNFNSWARRVRLDFSDIYKKGFIFDELGGQLTFDNGLMTLTEPLKMEGPSSEMKLSGSIDYPTQTVDAKLRASLPIASNLTLITALAGGLPAAAGVYIVSKIFKKQFKKVSSITYLINGDLSKPSVNIEQKKVDSESELDDLSDVSDGE